MGMLPCNRRVAPSADAARAATSASFYPLARLHGPRAASRPREEAREAAPRYRATRPQGAHVARYDVAPSARVHSAPQPRPPRPSSRRERPQQLPQQPPARPAPAALAGLSSAWSVENERLEEQQRKHREQQLAAQRRQGELEQLDQTKKLLAQTKERSREIQKALKEKAFADRIEWWKRADPS